MALAASPAVAVSWSNRTRRTALLVLSLVAASAPAIAGDQVYIWRDPSGVVRFSPVRETAQPASVESTSARDGDTPQQPDTGSRSAY